MAETYPVLYIIFTLLNAVRRGIERKNIWREFRRQKITLKPRLAFWIALCRELGIITEREGQLRVTSHARAWCNKTAEEQAFQLIASWQNAPKNQRARQFRKKLLWKLQNDKLLTSKDLKAFNGLAALGFISEGKLSAWGKLFIKGEGTPPTQKPVDPCAIKEDHFIALIPQHTDLLWDIENHLRPSIPGKYPLTKRALGFHKGDPQMLIDLLEKGLQTKIPAYTKAMIFGQPSIRVAEGVIIEFSTPGELAQLRRQPVFREYIEEFLSPQRVLVPAQKAKKLFQLLQRRGAFIQQNEEQPKVEKKRTHFPQKKILQPVIGNSAPKLTVIEKYKQLGQALDVLYRAPGYPAEQRRITPLFIEERGAITYVIAYCQTRRAQRMFRLDRMEVPGTW